jgi:hypothetical protein
MVVHDAGHRDLHSEQGALAGEHPCRADNPVIKVHDVAWLEFEKPDHAPKVDREGAQRLTLVTGTPNAWRTSLNETGWCDVVAVAPATSAPAHRGRAVSLLEVGEQGAVLVRPDGHVAWRSTADAATSSDELVAHAEPAWPFTRGAVR